MVDDHAHERVPQAGQGSLRRGPCRERQLGVRPFPDCEARDVLGRVIEEGDQPGLPGPVGVAEFREVRVNDFQRPDLRLAASRQQVRPRTGGVNRPPDGARLRPADAPQRQIPEPVQPLHHLAVHAVPVRLPELCGGPPVSVLRVCFGDRLQRRLQVRVLLRVRHPRSSVVVPRRARQPDRSQRRRQAVCLACTGDERHLRLHAQPLRPKKFFRSAISTSFLPSSCSRSRMRRSYSLIVVSSAKTSGARSMKRRFQSPTEFGCTPYALATWPGVLSPSRHLQHHLRLELGRVPPPRHDNLLRVCLVLPWPAQLPEVNSTMVRCSRFGGHIPDDSGLECDLS